MSTDVQQQALNSIDHFIAVGRKMLEVPVLAQFPAAANDLYNIAQKLLTANENMARWLNHFLQFDFRGPDARTRFLKLLGDYRTTKAGAGFHDMKYSCGDIFFIYQQNIAAKIPDMFPDDQNAAEEARMAFMEMGNADEDMVAFIYETVIGSIDRFAADSEACLDRSDLNCAEERRLQFKVASADLSGRLERFASDLSDLVLKYARLARRPVTLT
jgi:hypothetical protein